MAKSDKAKLKQEFLDFLKERAVTPKATAVEAWLKKNAEGSKRNEISCLLKGKAVSTIYAQKLVHYILKLGERSSTHELYVAFRDFVMGQTGHALDDRSEQALTLAILDDEDYLTGGIPRSIELFLGSNSFMNSGVECSSPELRDAIQWMYIEFGRQIAGNVSIHKAEEVAAENIGATCEEFFEAAEKWHCFDSWTITSVPIKGQPAGMTAVLPLKESTYQDFRAGKVLPQNLTAKDLQRPSRFLWLSFAAARPTELDGPSTNITTNLNFALLHQLAVLSNCDGPDSQIDPHIIACAPSSIAKHRLESGGFREVGTKMPHSGFPIYEQVIAWEESNNIAVFVFGLMSQFSGSMKSQLRPRKAPKPQKGRRRRD